MELTTEQLASIEEVQMRYQADVRAAEAAYRAAIEPHEAAIASERDKLRKYIEGRIEQAKVEKKAAFSAIVAQV